MKKIPFSYTENTLHRSSSLFTCRTFFPEERFLKLQTTIMLLIQNPTQKVISSSHGFSHIHHTLCQSQNENSTSLSATELQIKYRQNVRKMDHPEISSAILDVVDTLCNCPEKDIIHSFISIINSHLICLHQWVRNTF